MAVNIHPTAIVESGAELDENVVIGPYAFIGPGVRLGAGTEVRHHATIEGNTSLGRENIVHPYAFLGGRTQDLKYKGGNPALRIGDHNEFREYVTAHCATSEESETVIGSHNHFLATTHIAHDCRLGNAIIMSNYAGLAGHVVVDDHAVIMGYGAVHQFCRIGAHAVVGACCKLVQDLPPFIIAEGNPATARTINKIGMERHQFADVDIQNARRIFKILYREGLNRSQAVDRIRDSDFADSPVALRFLDFIEASDRGLLRYGVED